MDKGIEALCNHFRSYIREAVEIKSIGLDTAWQDKAAKFVIVRRRVDELRNNLAMHTAVVVGHHPEEDPAILTQKLNEISSMALDNFIKQFVD